MNTEPNQTSEALLALKKTDRKNKRKQRQLKTFNINITPQQYHGMRFLGNFKTYHQNQELRDPRIAQLDHQLFFNKVVMDLGAGDCGTTVEVALRMLPERIVAVEIDKELVAMGKRRIDKVISKNEKYRAVAENASLQKTLQQFPLFFKEQLKQSIDKYVINIPRTLELISEQMKANCEFPQNIRLFNDNFFNMQAQPIYDTILCLDIVKWVHLSLGDKGIEAFFTKIYDFLKPQGYLILETTKHRSYRKRRNMNPIYKKNYDENIHVDPLTFPSLLRYMGFDLVKEIQPRPLLNVDNAIQIYRKTTISQSQ